MLARRQDRNDVFLALQDSVIVKCEYVDRLATVKEGMHWPWADRRVDTLCLVECCVKLMSSDTACMVSQKRDLASGHVGIAAISMSALIVLRSLQRLL